MYRQKLQQFARAAQFPVAEYGLDGFVLTEQIIGDLREKPYVDQWQTIISKGWFHVRTEDHSLFLFNEVGDQPSFSFIDCPLDVQTFPEFLRSLDIEVTARNRQLLEEDYTQLLQTASLKPAFTPIRCDLDKAAYSQGVHPLVHIHVGLHNSLRLALRRKMSSISFFLFVMRHAYPSHWQRLLLQTPTKHLRKHIRGDCALVPTDFWHELDEIELHLT